MRLVFCSVLSMVIGIAEAGGTFECNTSKDCVPSTATCLNNICKCPDSEVFNNDGTKCLPYTKVIMEACETDSQCNLFGGAIACINKQCQCQDGHVYLRRHCIRKLPNHGACDTNAQCFDGFDYNSRICKHGQCRCADEYYSRHDVDCRPKIALGQACSLSIDCDDADTICAGRKCIREDAFNEAVIQQENHWYEDDLDEEANVTHLKMETDMKMSEVEGIGLNAACALGDGCADANALCSPLSLTCACRNGYYEKLGKCAAELGMVCSKKAECPSQSKCVNGVCSCATNKNYDASNQKCRATAYQNGSRLMCASDNSCRVLTQHYYCDAEEKFCRCEKGYAINDDFICEMSCLIDSDCSLEHQICDDTLNKCVCAPEYKNEGGLCKPRIDGACKMHAECKELDENSYCFKGRCVCNAGFVKHNYACYPEIPIDKECLYNEQCAWKYNATCRQVISGRKLCKCDPDFIKVNGNCYRMAVREGDYCTHPAVCMEGSRCEKSKCTCAAGLVPSGDKRSCRVVLDIDNSAVGRFTASNPTLLSTLIFVATLVVFK